MEIPEIYWNTICEEIRCPESDCNGRITLDSVVSVNYSYKAEREYKKLKEFVSKKTKGELCEFYDSITENPENALEHKIGLQIAKEITDFALCALTDATFFRARHIDKKELDLPFSEYDMNPPPISKATEGRYNRDGERVLYLGEKQFVCAAEIHYGNPKYNCVMQKVKVTSDRIMDIAHYATFEELGNMPLFVAGLLFSELILKRGRKGTEKHPEYAITHFIADECRKRGVEGILYPSAVSKNKDGSRGINLVLFDWEKQVFFVDKPYLFQGDEKVIELKMVDSRTGKKVQPVIQMFADI